MLSLDPEKSDIRIIFEVLPAGIIPPAGFLISVKQVEKEIIKSFSVTFH